MWREAPDLDSRPAGPDFRIWGQANDDVNGGWIAGMQMGGNRYEFPLASWFQGGDLRISGAPAPLCSGDCDTIAAISSGRWMAFHNAAHHSAAHTFHYGDPGDHAILGDWNGDGCDGYGLYRPSAGSFFLSNDMNTTMDHDGFLFGPLGATPMTGEFDGNGTDQVAVYLGPTLYLGSGAPNGAANPAVITTFDYGAPGDRYLFGDWSGNGTDTVGSYRPSNGTIYLRDSNSAGAADYDFFIGTFEVVVSGRE